MLLEYENLLLNENAYFFRLKKQLTRSIVERIFDDCRSEKKATLAFDQKVRQSYVRGSSEIAKISLQIFKFNRRPPFLSREVKNAYETKFGYLLFIEIGEYLAVIKKYASLSDLFYTHACKIDYEILARFMVNDKSKYEKIIATNMNPAIYALQRKTSEAQDLKQILSRFGASKQILNSVRIDNQGKKSTVALNTSRINSFNLHIDFDDIILWIADTVKLLTLAYREIPKSNFIDSFAVPVKFVEKIDELKPAYLLLRFGQLKDDIESEFIKQLIGEGGKRIGIDKELFAKERLFELSQVSEDTYGNGEFQVKVHSESITLSIEPFKKIYIDTGEEYKQSLNKYLNIGSHFIIVFDEFEYVYTHRMIFRDSKLLGDTETLLETFIPMDEMKSVNSEKGAGYKTVSTEFQPHSLFDVVEKNAARTAKYLICDDMGVEWGDFISISDEEIVFYHAKYQRDGQSATNLEEVFGQVQKNFGFLQLTEEMIDYRKNRWEQNYKIDKINTSISRIRKAPAGDKSVESLKKYVTHVSGNPHVKRKIFVVINFISKNELEKGIGFLKKGKIFNNKGVTLQILWIVNSLLALSNDLSVEFRIICKP